MVGDDVAVGGRPDNFALFSRDGEQVATVPVQRWVAVEGPPRLLEAVPGQAAAVAEVVADGVLDVFDATGKIVSTVPLALDMPTGPFWGRRRVREQRQSPDVCHRLARHVLVRPWYLHRGGPDDLTAPGRSRQA